MFTAHKTLINTLLAAAVTLGATMSTPAMAGTYVSWGWNAPPVRVEVREACPGPNYTWVTGRWEWSAWTGWQWHRGFWEYVAPVYSYYHPAPAYYQPAPAYYYHPNYYGEVRDRDDRYEHGDRDDHRAEAQHYDNHVQHEANDRNARRDGAVRR